MTPKSQTQPHLRCGNAYISLPLRMLFLTWISSAKYNWSVFLSAEGKCGADSFAVAMAVAVIRDVSLVVGDVVSEFACSTGR